MKIQLPKRTVYKGNKIPANTPFDVDKQDTNRFVSQGAWIFEEEAKEEKAHGDSNKPTGQSEVVPIPSDSGRSKNK